MNISMTKPKKAVKVACVYRLLLDSDVDRVFKYQMDMKKMWDSDLIIRGKKVSPDSKVHEANMGPIWGQQDPGGPHVGHMNLAIWVSLIVFYDW